MVDFAMIGAAGFIATRHMRAIAETGNQLVAAFDPKDSVGIIDSFFPDAHFFVEFERFDRHVDKLRRRGHPIDYVTVCSPNYLHDSHIRFGLRSGAHVICEKPLVLNPWNIDGIEELERESGRRVYNVLQLRHHPAIMELRRRIAARILEFPDAQADVELTYITSRGRWYDASWKGDTAKSGGIATNIGVHFFDMLQWVFGPVTRNVLHFAAERTIAGFLELRHARVRWLLSIDAALLPAGALASGKRTSRSIRVDGDEVEFSEGFTDLHSAAYRDILAGGGFSVSEARPSIQVVHDIRHARAERSRGEPHPLLATIDPA
jgi:UDP-N-acetyl-2-amino-2-deoxyglucuronate dehydrogenase